MYSGDAIAFYGSINGLNLTMAKPLILLALKDSSLSE